MFYQLSEQVTILVVKLKGMFLILGGKAGLSQKLCFKSNHYSTSTGVKLAVSKLSYMDKLATLEAVMYHFYLSEYCNNGLSM